MPKTATALSGAVSKGGAIDANAKPPFVAAAGSGFIAEQIIALAEANGVPVEHDPALATLLAGVGVGHHIPPELYQAIAELLVFLYDLEARVSD